MSYIEFTTLTHSDVGVNLFENPRANDTCVEFVGVMGEIYVDVDDIDELIEVLTMYKKYINREAE